MRTMFTYQLKIITFSILSIIFFLGQNLFVFAQVIPEESFTGPDNQNIQGENITTESGAKKELSKKQDQTVTTTIDGSDISIQFNLEGSDEDETNNKEKILMHESKNVLKQQDNDQEETTLISDEKIIETEDTITPNETTAIEVQNESSLVVELLDEEGLSTKTINIDANDDVVHADIEEESDEDNSIQEPSPEVDIVKSKESISSDFDSDHDIVGSLDGYEIIPDDSFTGIKENLRYKHTKQFNSRSIDFTFTDNNTDENLIIMSDQRDYNALTEQEVFVSVTNIGDYEELVNLQVYFPKSKGNLKSIEKWVEGVPMEDGQPNVIEEQFFCAQGWQPTVIDDDASLSMISRYFVEIGYSFMKAPQALAQMLVDDDSTQEPEQQRKTNQESSQTVVTDTKKSSVTKQKENKIQNEDETESQGEKVETQPIESLSQDNQTAINTIDSNSGSISLPVGDENDEASLESENLGESQTTSDSNNSLKEATEEAPQDKSYSCSSKKIRYCDYLSKDKRDCFVRAYGNKDTETVREYDRWQKINTSSKKLIAPNSLTEKIVGGAIQQKKVPDSLIVKKATSIEKEDKLINTLAPGETNYYRLMINFPEGSRGEFFVEAFGHKDGYGLLDPWWDSNWLFKLPIAVDNSASSSALNEYQVRLEIDSAQTHFWSQVQSDGDDVRFLNTNENDELDFYQMHFDYTNQEAIYWVKLDNISANSIEEIYLYYGNSTASATHSGEDTFTYASPQPRYYAVQSEATSAAQAVTFFDNNSVNLGSSSDSDWDTGTSDNPKVISGTSYSLGDSLNATGPVSTEVQPINNGEMWTPGIWQGTNFVTTFPRSGSNFYFLNTQSNSANVEIFKDGVSQTTFSLGPGATSTQTLSHTDDAHMRITSDVPIMVFQYASGSRDYANVPPPALEHHGVARRLRIICSTDDTFVRIYYSDGVDEVNTDCDKNEVWSVDTGNTGGSGPSYFAVADNPIHTLSYADGDGTELQVGYSSTDLDTNYLITTDYEYIACSAPYENTTISVFDLNENEIVSSGDLGSNGDNYPHHWKDGTTRTGGHHIRADKPVYCYNEENSQGDERNIGNIVLNRKFAEVEPTLTIAAFEVAAPEPPVVTELFEFEKTSTTTPSFEFSTFSVDGNDLLYQVRWDTDSTFSAPTVRTSDVDPGFENIDTPSDTHPFNSGDSIRFTVQPGDALVDGETYWYQIRAKEPLGTDIYGQWSDRRSITVDTAVNASTWYQNTDEQFDEKNAFNLTRVSGNDSVEVADSIGQYVEVQRNKISLAPNELFADWILPNPVSSVENAFIIMHGRMNSGNLQRVEAQVEFLNKSTVRISRIESGSDADFTIQVVEANQNAPTPAFSVLHGETNFSSSDTVRDETISTVDASNSMVLINNTVGTDDRTDAEIRAELTSNTNLNLSRLSSGSAANVNYQVIEWNPLVHVQKGSITMTGSSTNQSINPVDLSRSMIFATWSADTNGLAQTSPRLWLNSSTQVSVDRGTSTGSVNIRYAVLEFPINVSVQSDNNVGSPFFDTVLDVNVPTPVTPQYTFNTHTNKVTGTGTAFPRPYVTSYLAGETLLELRQNYPGQTKTVTYYLADTSNWEYFIDNSTGTMMSDPIAFADGNRNSDSSRWESVEFNADETNGDIKIRLYYRESNSCDTLIPDTDLLGNSTGFDSTIDISGLSTVTYSELCLEVELTEGAGSPKLLDWTVRWGGESEFIAFDLSDNVIGFGKLSTTDSRYASSDGLGSLTEAVAHQVTASTNVTGGYTVSINGHTLKSQEGYSIDAIGNSPVTTNPGTEQFGLRAEVGGTGNVVSPYNTVNYAFDDTSTNTIFSGSGDGTVHTYDVYYLANIAPDTAAGSYETNLSYTITATY